MTTDRDTELARTIRALHADWRAWAAADQARRDTAAANRTRRAKTLDNLTALLSGGLIIAGISIVIVSMIGLLT